MLKKFIVADEPANNLRKNEIVMERLNKHKCTKKRW